MGLCGDSGGSSNPCPWPCLGVPTGLGSCWSLTPHPASRTLHPTPCTPYPTRCALHPRPFTPHPAVCTLHPAQHTVHPAPRTPYPAPCTSHPAPHTLHPVLCTLSGPLWGRGTQDPGVGSGKWAPGKMRPRRLKVLGAGVSRPGQGCRATAQLRPSASMGAVLVLPAEPSPGHRMGSPAQPPCGVSAMSPSLHHTGELPGAALPQLLGGWQGWGQGQGW